MEMLKVILVNFFFLGVLIPQKINSKEVDLLNFLVCSTEENSLIDACYLSWKDWGFDSYSDLPAKNKNSTGGLSTFDLDSLMTQKDKEKIDEILQSNRTFTFKIDDLSCKGKLNSKKGFVPKKIIYSYSFPIQAKGTNNELYGIVLEQKSFELNSEIKLKVFVKQLYSWELVYENLLAFS